jgi:hypothetical protein
MTLTHPEDGMRNDDSAENTMNEDTGGSRSRARGWMRGAAGLVLLIAVALVPAACGGGSSTSSTGSAPSAGSYQAGGSTDHQRKVAFSQCMRSHGVPNFPDPTSNGNFINNGNFDTSSPAVQAAQKACRGLLPNGGRPTQAQQQQRNARFLKLARCMRSHGVPNFPDPKNGQMTLQSSGVSRADTQTPRFQAAMRTCQSQSGLGAP